MITSKSLIGLGLLCATICFVGCRDKNATPDKGTNVSGTATTAKPAVSHKVSLHAVVASYSKSLNLGISAGISEELKLKREANYVEAEYVKAVEDFKRTWREGAKADGDPIADFEPARQAFAASQQVLAKRQDLEARYEARQKTRIESQDAWHKSWDETSKLLADYAKLVGLTYDRADESVALRNLSLEYVQALKADASVTPELQAAASEAEPLLQALIAGQTTTDALEAEVKALTARFLAASDRQKERLSKVLTKPVDQATAAEYEDLRKAGREYLELQAEVEAAVQSYKDANEKSDPLFAPARDALSKVVALDKKA